MWNRSRWKAYLSIMICAILVSMCRFYDEKVGYVTYQNGWSCRTYTDYLSSGSNLKNGHECQVICANGTSGAPQDVENPLILEQVDLNTFCSPASPTATEVAVTSTVSRTPTITATVGVGDSTSTLPPATPTNTPSPVVPMLADEMTSCGKNNELGWWVNFRFAEPRVSITDKNLEVTIGGQKIPCGINQANTSLLTCFVSQNLTYPAEVIVKLDSVEVNRFPVTLSEEVCASSTSATPLDKNDSPEPQATSTAEIVPPTEPPTAEATPQ